MIRAYSETQDLQAKHRLSPFRREWDRAALRVWLRAELHDVHVLELEGQGDRK